MSVAPARRAALSVLRRVRERDAFGPETLDAVLRASGLSRLDAALATRLTYGTLQTQGVLDEAIDHFASDPRAIEPGVRDALRLAAYELLFMRTPARAAVHEGVDAARSARKQAAGLANAVLRRIADQAPSFPWGDPEADDAALARATGHPEWLVRMWIAELGRERARELLSANQEPAPLYVWANPFMGSLVEATDTLVADGADPHPATLPGCLRCGDAHAAVTGSAVASGLALVADEAAQMAPRLVSARPGQVIMDLAAGRGTKTAEIQADAVAAGGACELIALDVHPFKIEVLQRRMADLHVPSVTALAGDILSLADVAGLPAAADAVLLDAPCSGLGALRRRPEKRWRLTPDDIVRMAQLQSALLAAASRAVRAGGRLVYSTCSLSRAENQEVADGFLDASGGRFIRVDISGEIPAAWSQFVTSEGYFQSVPAVGGPDGHFVAVFMRVE